MKKKKRKRKEKKRKRKEKEKKGQFFEINKLFTLRCFLLEIWSSRRKTHDQISVN